MVLASALTWRTGYSHNLAMTIELTSCFPWTLPLVSRKKILLWRAVRKGAKFGSAELVSGEVPLLSIDCRGYLNLVLMISRVSTSFSLPASCYDFKGLDHTVLLLKMHTRECILEARLEMPGCFNLMDLQGIGSKISINQQVMNHKEYLNRL